MAIPAKFSWQVNPVRDELLLRAAFCDLEDSMDAGHTGLFGCFLREPPHLAVANGIEEFMAFVCELLGAPVVSTGVREVIRLNEPCLVQELDVAGNLLSGVSRNV